jgi:hypothetical protein
MPVVSNASRQINKPVVRKPVAARHRRTNQQTLMNRSLRLTTAALAAITCTVFAGENPMIGGAPMQSNKVGDVMQSYGVIHVIDTVLMP